MKFYFLKALINTSLLHLSVVLRCVFNSYRKMPMFCIAFTVYSILQYLLTKFHRQFKRKATDVFNQMAKSEENL